ncbi:hypothetical protein [Glacieibacterium frigidum]|uniref:Uncharacterized protein n=1 Tax=Glacieibacterium frigidum TaxID=2593303 RepID=A0A552UHS1_9SPHN|nr:hypothetical protein [Glacieibacterium frigidum]TRW17737.1 hypothetical protein FMM06_06265 [Glacieibacterium frigidum]
MTTANWKTQVEGQIGRALKSVELQDADCDFASMHPAFQTSELHVEEFVQAVVATCRTNDRLQNWIDRTSFELERRFQLRVIRAAEEVQKQIDEAVLTTFGRLHAASPNMQQKQVNEAVSTAFDSLHSATANRRVEVAARTAFTVTVTAALTFLMVVVAQKSEWIPVPGVSSSDRQAMAVGRDRARLGQLEIAQWATAKIPDIAMTKDLEPVVAALSKCRALADDRRAMRRCSQRYAR